MSDREVYPNAPLALVALEVRHTYCDAARASELRERLLDVLPIHRPVTVQMLVAALPGPGQITTKLATRFLSESCTTSLTMQDESFTIETTSYVRYEELRDLAERVLVERQIVAPIAAINRLGLRYINEVRVPSLDSVGGWREWVDPALLGPTEAANGSDFTAGATQGLTTFEQPGGYGLVVRYGSFDGAAVIPSGDLQRTKTDVGPFFLIDIDSSWTPMPASPHNGEHILKQVDDLKRPVKNLFEQLVTERLREEVLRRAQ